MKYLKKLIYIAQGIYNFIKYKLNIIDQDTYLIYLKRRLTCQNCEHKQYNFCKICLCNLTLKQLSNDKCNLWEI